jgi:predicted ester cyclase
MAAYRFADGKIAERWAIRDDLGMLRQLGAL